MQTIDAGDYDTTTGKMNWFGAQAWVAYLNNISYGGVTGWRLPTTIPATFGLNQTGSELGHLCYAELNRVAYPNPGFGILGTGTLSDTSGSVGPFSNVHTYVYWSGTEYAPALARAWSFGTGFGDQDIGNKTFPYYGWAVRPGQVAAVPVPAAVWLMGSGLVGLVGWGRRKASTVAIG